MPISTAILDSFSAPMLGTILSTLVHEMVHQWQHHFGKQPPEGYHDKQWVVKIREVRLIPHGHRRAWRKEACQKLTHLIEQGDPYGLPMPS